MCSMNDIYKYNSNHTLQNPHATRKNTEQRGRPLLFIVEIEYNEGTNKRVKKILKYHPNIDMEPFFDWDSKGDHIL